MNDTKTKKKMAFPHTLIIILIMIVFAAILTYLIQAGQYDRIEVAGRKVVDPAAIIRCRPTVQPHLISLWQSLQACRPWHPYQTWFLLSAVPLP